jgi:hypothetical protein
MKVTRASWPVACSDTYRVSPSATTPNGRDAVGSARFLIVSVPSARQNVRVASSWLVTASHSPTAVSVRGLSPTAIRRSTAKPFSSPAAIMISSESGLTTATRSPTRVTVVLCRGAHTGGSVAVIVTPAASDWPMPSYTVRIGL